MILPMTVDKHKKTTNNYSSNSYQSSTQTLHNSQYTSNSFNSALNSNHFQSNMNQNMNSSEEQELETDFFKDMVPQFRKPKKVLLASNQSIDAQTSNRFGVDMKATINQSKELGVIEHFEDGGTSWEDSAAHEEMWDTDQSLRDLRQAEREKRIAEHQRIKMEKEFKRSKQPKSGNLLATKIS